MRRFLLVGLLVCAAVGCNSKSNNAVVQGDVQQAQQIVQSCLTKGDLLTAAGRTKILDCVAPPGKSQALQTCVQTKASTAKFVTKSERDAFYQQLAQCLEANR